jgi:hypothetical protein
VSRVGIEPTTRRLRARRNSTPIEADFGKTGSAFFSKSRPQPILVPFSGKRCTHVAQGRSDQLSHRSSTLSDFIRVRKALLDRPPRESPQCHAISTTSGHCKAARGFGGVVDSPFPIRLFLKRRSAVREHCVHQERVSMRSSPSMRSFLFRHVCVISKCDTNLVAAWLGTEAIGRLIGGGWLTTSRSACSPEHSASAFMLRIGGRARKP